MGAIFSVHKDEAPGCEAPLRTSVVKLQVVELLSVAQISDKDDAGKAWCRDEGVVELQEVFDNLGDFASAIGLSKIQKDRFEKTMKDRFEKTMQAAINECTEEGGSGGAKEGRHRVARQMNRFGENADVPTQGERALFPPGYKPGPGGARKAIEKTHTFTKEDLDKMEERAKLTTTRLQKRGLSVTENNSLCFDAYTEESVFYKDMNQALRKNTEDSEKILDDYRDYLHHFGEGIQNLPSFLGTVYRGIRSVVKSELYKPGTTITWQSPSSSSKSMLVPANFVDWVGNTKCRGTFFIITSTSGKDISQFSRFPEEEEVLFKPNTHFEVDRIASDEEKERLLPDFAEQGWDLQNLMVIVLKQA